MCLRANKVEEDRERTLGNSLRKADWNSPGWWPLLWTSMRLPTPPLPEWGTRRGCQEYLLTPNLHFVSSVYRCPIPCFFQKSVRLSPLPTAAPQPAAKELPTICCDLISG